MNIFLASLHENKTGLILAKIVAISSVSILYFILVCFGNRDFYGLESIFWLTLTFIISSIIGVILCFILSRYIYPHFSK